MSRIRKVTQYLVIVISGCLLFATGTYFLVWKSMGAFDFLHEDYYKILSSKVILDKALYKKGDSIFGFTELEVLKRYGPENILKKGKGISAEL